MATEKLVDALDVSAGELLKIISAIKRLTHLFNRGSIKI